MVLFPYLTTLGLFVTMKLWIPVLVLGFFIVAFHCYDKDRYKVNYGVGSSKKKLLNSAGWNRYIAVLLLCLVATSSAHTQIKNTHQVSCITLCFHNFDAFSTLYYLLHDRLWI